MLRLAVVEGHAIDVHAVDRHQFADRDRHVIETRRAEFRKRVVHRGALRILHVHDEPVGRIGRQLAAPVVEQRGGDDRKQQQCGQAQRDRAGLHHAQGTATRQCTCPQPQQRRGQYARQFPASRLQRDQSDCDRDGYEVEQVEMAWHPGGTLAEHRDRRHGFQFRQRRQRESGEHRKPDAGRGEGGPQRQRCLLRGRRQ